MEKVFRIAIDGPSGAGKSTIAKAIAKKMNIDYIDTGAMYRAIGYKIIQEKIDDRDLDKLQKMLDNTSIDFSKGDVILDGEIVSQYIRTPEISMKASTCSAIGIVREKLVDLQRKMGQTKSVIMDGRDIGTNVLTDAEYKFFLTASAEERANRRYKELIEKGQTVEYQDILKDIIERDHNDTTRKINPLKKADDAIEVDTTGMSEDEVINFLYKEIK
ncbi:MAG: (d)CMP kinase [Anaerovoracaceae bacterium]